MQKRAQGGINAAILVAIIAGLIILYIIFLPASQRESLLTSNQTGTGIGTENPNVLLRVFPGTLSTSAGLENKKSIPDIFLVETTSAKELASLNPFIVRNSWFDKKDQKIDFELDDPDNTDNAVLTFAAKQRQGILTVNLNGVTIFENEIASDTIEPIKLDKRLLRKTNTLEFSVSSVGLRFWTTNEYSFDSVKIIGDITDTSRQESSNIFTISDSEYSSMDKATLKFIPYCGSLNDFGALDIFVNNKKVFSSVPVCSNLYKQSLPKSILSEGENNIVFKTSKGSYSVEQVQISLEFKAPQVKTYYFEIDSATANKIKSGSRNVMLTIKFGSNKQNIVKLDVNGHTETVQTDKQVFSEKINSKISEGNNYARLDPLSDVEVIELRVELA